MQHVLDLETNASFVCYVRVWHVPLFFICSRVRTIVIFLFILCVRAIAFCFFFSSIQFFFFFSCSSSFDCCLLYIFNARVPFDCVYARTKGFECIRMRENSMHCMVFGIVINLLKCIHCMKIINDKEKESNEEAFCPQERIRDRFLICIFLFVNFTKTFCILIHHVWNQSWFLNTFFFVVQTK